MDRSKMKDRDGGFCFDLRFHRSHDSLRAQALDLNDAMHRHRVQGAVTRAFDSAVVSPMRKWIVEQVLRGLRIFS